jgi:hypothetical protein
MWIALSMPAGDDGLVGNWSPGIGDPSFVGWLTVAAYFFTAWRCRSAALRISKRMAGLGEARRERLFWFVVAVLFALLGLNKQLDLQSLLTEVGRLLARSEGWYEDRRPVQYAFIAVVAAVGIAGAAFGVFLVRRATHGAKIAAAGTALVTAFVVIRAASFHHFDEFIDSELLGLRANWLLELTGIAVVLYGTVAQQRTLQTRGNLPP